MSKKKDHGRIIILFVLALAVLLLATSYSATDQPSTLTTDPAPLRATALDVKEETTTPTEPPTAPPTEAQETQEAQPAKIEHTKTPLGTKFYIPDYAAEMIGRTIWGEAGGIQSEAERAAVAWCILNRVDATGLTIEQVVTAPKQFHGYRDASWGNCPTEHIELAKNVLNRWAAEKYGVDDNGRVLPPEYLYFVGDGVHNYFTTDYLGTEYWDWSLPDPYI